jgi:predicted membrane protein
VTAALKTLFLGTMVIGWLLAAGVPAQIVGDSAGLERVLNQMDAAARNFTTTEANVCLGRIPEGDQRNRDGDGQNLFPA